MIMVGHRLKQASGASCGWCSTQRRPCTGHGRVLVQQVRKRRRTAMHPENSAVVIDRCSKSSKHLSQLRKLAGNVLQRFAENHDRLRVTTSATSPGRLRP